MEDGGYMVEYGEEDEKGGWRLDTRLRLDSLGALYFEVD